MCRCRSPILGRRRTRMVTPRCGIVILSPDYIKDGKCRTKTELDAFA